MDNDTMVEAFKYLNHDQLAINSLVSKKFRDLIRGHRHKLASFNFHNLVMDFDLCVLCHNKVQHEHKTEKLLIVDQSQTADLSCNARIESVKRCINSLEHSCKCKDANCKIVTCHKMKIVVQHTKTCRKRQQSNCPVCKQFIALCCYHAIHCNLEMCSVPFCSNIRQKLEERKRSQIR